MLAKFGIDEIYIATLSPDLLHKLHNRAMFSLDGNDVVIQKLVKNDIILIYNKQRPTASLVYRFLEHLDRDPGKDVFIKENTLIDQEELYEAIKTKKYVLVTHHSNL